MSNISTILVLDTETTGTDPKEATVLEVAWAVLALPDEGASDDERAWSIVEWQSGLIAHEGEIPPEARAVHHISPEDVAPGRPGVEERYLVLGQMLQAEVPGEMVYAAHNAPFDRSFLPELRLPWIDTLRCAQHVWPDAPRYGNQVLRYWLGVEPRPELIAGLAPHRALYDVAVTSEILLALLADHSVEELLRLSDTPVLLKTCHLKKYKDVPWSQVPRDYLRWITTTDMLKDDPNLAYTVRHYLSS